MVSAANGSLSFGYQMIRERFKRTNNDNSTAQAFGGQPVPVTHAATMEIQSRNSCPGFFAPEPARLRRKKQGGTRIHRAAFSTPGHKSSPFPEIEIHFPRAIGHSFSANVVPTDPLTVDEAQTLGGACGLSDCRF